MANNHWFSKLGPMIGLCYLVFGWLGSFLFGIALATALVTGQSWLEDYGHWQVYSYFSGLLVLTVLGTLACFSLLVVIDNTKEKANFLKQHHSRLVMGILCVIILLGFFGYQCCFNESQNIFLGLLGLHLPLAIPAMIAFNYIRRGQNTPEKEYTNLERAFT